VTEGPSTATSRPAGQPWSSGPPANVDRAARDRRPARRAAGLASALLAGAAAVPLLGAVGALPLGGGRAAAGALRTADPAEPAPSAPPRRDAEGAPTPTDPPAPPAAASRSEDRAPPDEVEAPFDLLERVRGDELDGFHAALARTAGLREGAVTRVVHLGDSSIGLDQLTHGIRRRMQRRFGDAGPGFVLLQPHSASYRHAVAHPGVRRKWEFCFLIFRCRRDGHYGLGGVTFRSGGGAATVYQVPDAGGDDGAATRFELWYATQPHGGSLVVTAGGRRRVLDTEGPRLEDARWSRRLPEGARWVRVQARGGPVRAYGVVLEHERPGVVWDGLSMIGAFTHRLLAQDAEHLAGQIRWRDPDLVVLSYGGNDLRRFAAGRVDQDGLEAETRQAIRHIRRGRPGVSCIVVGINDHRKSGALVVGPDEVEGVLMAQRRAARAEGCAFFDTYRAMGGRGAFERWAAHRPPLVANDQKHLTRAGRVILSRRIYDALLRDHDRWRARRFR